MRIGPMPLRQALLGGLLCTAPALAQDRQRYLEDYEFLVETVARDGAAVQSKKIDWKKEAAELKPLFAGCKSDLEHVQNVMRLLARLEDSHTGVTDSRAEGPLPSKFDGLYGGGLWIAWEDGRVMVRGHRPGHSLERTLPLGSMILAVDGVPTWLFLELERERIARHVGISSDHSLWSSLSNKLFPFGERQTINALVLTPELETRTVTIPRWGPEGKSFDSRQATLPEGVAWQEGAVSTMLSFPWCKEVGYLRITGSMDEQTAAAVHRAFDALEGMEGLLLDCRSMGGGGDASAWEMAGRLFPEGANNGRHGRIEPSGSWQFAGPVVMLQDESEVSSAETFTWAVTETERVVSVGRPTGGWGIIPRGYQCPSGLVSFRLGVNDRPTPIRGVHTEGVGWPPDVLVPYGPLLWARPDVVAEIGLEVLRTMVAGATRKQAAEAFAAAFAGDLGPLERLEGVVAKQDPGWSSKDWCQRIQEDLELTIAMEKQALEEKKVDAVDAAGVARRLTALRERAKGLGVKSIAALEKAQKSLAKEAAAQADLAALARDGGIAEAAARKSWLSRHGGTRTGKLVKETVWK